jgi:hypothetical protein
MKRRRGFARAVSELRRAEAELVVALGTLREAIAALSGVAVHPTSPKPPRRRRKLSPEGREAISRAARARWARWRRERAR